MENTTTSILRNLSDLRMTESSEATFQFSVKSKFVFSIELLLATVTIGMNIVILIAFHIEKRLRTYSNQYIINITISDLLVGFIMLIRSTFALYRTWVFGDALFFVFVGIQNTLLGVSVLGVIAICIDRYLATWYPIHHFQRRSKTVAHVVNAITWVLSIAFWIPIATIWDLVSGGKSKSKSIVFSPNYGNHVYSIVGVTLCRMAIPFAVILVLYLKICVRVRTRRRERILKRFKRSSKVGVGTEPLAVKEYKMKNSWTKPRDDIDLRNNASRNDANHSSHDHTIPCSSNIGQRRIREQIKVKESKRGDHSGISIVAPSSEKKPARQITDHGVSTTIAARLQHQQNNNAGHIPVSENSKVMLTLTFIVVAFFVTWLPNAVSLIYNNVLTSDYVLNEVTRWITFSNSLLNPVAYAMAQPLFRTTIARLVKCRK
nr:histamine H2 receptor-like [Lytechinus pictus]